MEHAAIDTFETEDLLTAVDNIFPLAKHYQRILQIHQNELEHCKNIAELGCGTGILVTKYLEQGKKVTAIDIAQNSLQRLREKTDSNNLTIFKEDITNLKSIPDNSFDGASSMIMAHLLKDYESHIKEAYRILKPNGKFIITARKKDQNQERIVKIVEDSLIATGEFEKYEKDFVILRDKLLRTAKFRSVSLLSTKEAIEILQKIGFRDVKELPNATDGVMYSLVAKK